MSSESGQVNCFAQTAMDGALRNLVTAMLLASLLCCAVGCAQQSRPPEGLQNAQDRSQSAIVQENNRFTILRKPKVDDDSTLLETGYVYLRLRKTQTYIGDFVPANAPSYLERLAKGIVDRNNIALITLQINDSHTFPVLFVGRIDGEPVTRVSTNTVLSPAFLLGPTHSLKMKMEVRVGENVDQNIVAIVTDVAKSFGEYVAGIPPNLVSAIVRSDERSNRFDQLLNKKLSYADSGSIEDTIQASDLRHPFDIVIYVKDGGQDLVAFTIEVVYIPSLFVYSTKDGAPDFTNAEADRIYRHQLGGLRVGSDTTPLSIQALVNKDSLLSKLVQSIEPRDFDELCVEAPRYFIQYFSNDDAKLASWAVLHNARAYGKGPTANDGCLGDKTIARLRKAGISNDPRVPARVVAAKADRDSRCDLPSDKRPFGLKCD